MTKIEASKLMAMLVAAYPRGPWPDETRALYESELAHLDAQVGGEAVLQAIRTCKFAPAIAELIDLHDGIRKAQRRRELERADEQETTYLLEQRARRLTTGSTGTGSPNLQATSQANQELAAKIAGIGRGAA